MKSPFTGKEMTLNKELIETTFRKEKFDYTHHFYVCDETQERFTNTKLDELNVSQVYNKYRVKHHIPFPDEIKETREKYGLNCTKMSEILGFGVNSYRNYEKGEIPSKSNANLIRLSRDPNKFLDLVKDWNESSEKEKLRIIDKVVQVKKEEKQNFIDKILNGYLLHGDGPTEMTGFRNPSIEKISEMVVFFTEKTKPFKTKLNKLLFYADFLNFKTTGYSISGAKYMAIPYGPIPDGYESIYDHATKQGYVDVNRQQFPNGLVGDQYLPRIEKAFESELFSEVELKVLEKVAKVFGETNTSDLVEISHQEKAWKENHSSNAFINYSFAFDLIGIERL